MVRYSINDLEKLSGIKDHTIRMWEKRYNIIIPERTDTNIRYYNDCDLKKLLNISTLNRHGFKISNISRMDDREISERILEISGTRCDHEALINNLVVSMIEINERAFEHTLNTATLKLGFEKCVTHVLYPFLEKIGVLWLTGSINPAQEHFITNLIRQKLITAIEGLPNPASPDAKTFLLFLPEREMHELGLLFYNYLIKKNGFNVIYLGQSVPFDDLAEVVRIRHTDYLFTYFVAALKQKDIPEYLQRLSKAFPRKQIFITGIQVNGKKQPLPSNVTPVTDTETFKTILQKL